MSEEKRMLGNYEVVNSIYIGDKEVVFGVDKSDKCPFLVCYCDYHNPLGVPWATESVGGRGNAVFGTCLATGEKSRWEQYDVLGEIKPECMPAWAKEALAKIKEQQKEKKQKDLER